MPDQRRRPRSSFTQDFRRFFFRGLALILPPFLTVLILFQLWVFLYDYVGGPVNGLLRYSLSYLLQDARRMPPTQNEELWSQLSEVGPWVPVWVFQEVEEKSILKAKPMPTTVLDLYERYIYYKYYDTSHPELIRRIRAHIFSFSGLIVAAVAVYFIGHFLATFLGRSILQFTESTVVRMPVVRAVYPHVKQFIDFLLSERKIEYNRVVAVEYPRRGIWSLGLVTGEGIKDLEDATGQDLLTIFVPYSPTSMTGYAITVPRSEVLDLSVSVDEAIRFVVSGGVIRPERRKELGIPPTVSLEEPESAPAVHVRRLPRRNPSMIRIGTRGSRLARVQTEWVLGQLQETNPTKEFEVVEIQTGGDRDLQSKLSDMGGQGVFTKEIQRALLDDRIDVAVHSLKDLPTEKISGLIVGAVPERVSPLDVLVSRDYRDWRSLPDGATVATSSPRRRAQLLKLRADLSIADIRGNVPTRIRKMEELGIHAIILAHAGLRRLGLEKHVSQCFTPDEMLPAPGQGALALECRSDDTKVLKLLEALDDPIARQTTVAERSVLETLRAGCHAPMGAYATIADGMLSLRAGVFALDGKQHWMESQICRPEEAREVGAEVARRLLQSGADSVITNDEPDK